MDKNKQRTLAWESRRSLPVALLTLAAVALLIGAGAVAGSVGGEGTAGALRAAHMHSSAEALSGILQGIGLALFAVPLFYLFRAAQARASQVRPQMIGVVVVAPLFLLASTGFSIVAKSEAADLFVSGKAKSSLSRPEANEKCLTERHEKGVKSFDENVEAGNGETPLGACQREKIEESEASNAITEASLAAATSGFGLAGGLGLAVAFFYTCLWAMRTGLLGRLWGSLGMALGVTLVIGLLLIPMIWLLYFGLMVGGWAPGGRPPAWAAGEAVPWPTPGEKAAATLEATEPESKPADRAALEDGDSASAGERRKRKRRDS